MIQWNHDYCSIIVLCIYILVQFYPYALGAVHWLARMRVVTQDGYPACRIWYVWLSFSVAATSFTNRRKIDARLFRGEIVPVKLVQPICACCWGRG